MEGRSARKIRRERNRRRLPPRSAGFRWMRRIAGLLATAAFLGAGVAAALMVIPDSDSSAKATVVATPTPTPKAKPKPTPTPKPKPKSLTKAQKAARAAAVDEVLRQGYTTLKPGDYDPRATLRVLIGRPVGDASGGQYAFFFSGDTFLGKDASAPSSELTLTKRGKTAVTLTYGTYVAGDKACCPSGKEKVRFRLEAGRIHALDTIPLASARLVRTAA
jgi:hypothetical protein